MSDEEMDLLNAQSRLDRYLAHIEEALSAEDEDEVRQHIQEGMSVAQTAMDSLEEAISLAEDPDLTDRLEDAMHHLSVSTDLGEQALEGSDEDLTEYLSEMLKHAERSVEAAGHAVPQG